MALGHRRPIEARRQLDAIAESKQDDLRVKILRGYLEFAELHPDDAIDQWRRGLLLVGGSDQDLTWRLAFHLVQLGRYTEAEPLREQYLRLSGGDKNGLGKFLDALFDIGQGRLVAARQKLERIKDVVSNNYKSDVLLALGRCCEMMGDGEGALLAFRNAASAGPTLASPRLAIARHLEKRHPDEAIQEGRPSPGRGARRDFPAPGIHPPADRGDRGPGRRTTRGGSASSTTSSRGSKRLRRRTRCCSRTGPNTWPPPINCPGPWSC